MANQCWRVAVKLDATGANRTKLSQMVENGKLAFPLDKDFHGYATELAGMMVKDGLKAKSDAVREAAVDMLRDVAAADHLSKLSKALDSVAGLKFDMQLGDVAEANRGGFARFHLFPSSHCGQCVGQLFVAVRRSRQAY